MLKEPLNSLAVEPNNTSDDSTNGNTALQAVIIHHVELVVDPIMKYDHLVRQLVKWI